MKEKISSNLEPNTNNEISLIEKVSTEMLSSSCQTTSASCCCANNTQPTPNPSFCVQNTQLTFNPPCLESQKLTLHALMNFKHQFTLYQKSNGPFSVSAFLPSSFLALCRNIPEGQIIDNLVKIAIGNPSDIRTELQNLRMNTEGIEAYGEYLVRFELIEGAARMSNVSETQLKKYFAKGIIPSECSNDIKFIPNL